MHKGELASLVLSCEHHLFVHQPWRKVQLVTQSLFWGKSWFVQDPHLVLTNYSAGIIGLQVATVLAELGYGKNIIVVAKHLPGDTSIDYTSPWYVGRAKQHSTGLTCQGWRKLFGYLW